MINTPPDSWKYNEKLEMLFLFYQCSDELLSEYTVDTYSLPMNNVMTLISELESINDLLVEYNILDRYYDKYIKYIIDELLFEIENDYIFKKVLNKRLSLLITGFKEAKENCNLLDRWIKYSKQACPKYRYLDLYKQELISLVNTTDKKKLIYCTKNYYICLINAGYSREFLYQAVRRFFSNKNYTIDNPNQIENFISKFDCTDVEMDFLILMNISTIDYIGSISKKIKINRHIEKIDIDKIRKANESDIAAMELFREYDALRNQKGEDISIIRFTTSDLDYYEVAKEFKHSVDFQLALSRYFKHFNSSKQVYKVIVKSKTDSHYREVKLKNELLKRPYIQQSKIDSRIINTLTAKSLGYSAFDSIYQAIQMHSESLDSNTFNTLLRNFWTALETLFLEPTAGQYKENVINSSLEIIQKTYILKLLRNLHKQILLAIDNENLTSLKIKSFEDFVVYFSSFKEKSIEFKNIYKYLDNNPLLRTRLFDMRLRLTNGNSIKRLLEIHKKRISWQLERIYRARNIATHIGVEVYNSYTLINHLHNYFDFIINFILCKSENGDYIESITSLVFESKNDNQIQIELLKKNENLDSNNYKYYLFGPDEKIISYEFET